MKELLLEDFVLHKIIMDKNMAKRRVKTLCVFINASFEYAFSMCAKINHVNKNEFHCEIDLIAKEKLFMTNYALIYCTYLIYRQIFF